MFTNARAVACAAAMSVAFIALPGVGGSAGPVNEPFLIVEQVFPPGLPDGLATFRYFAVYENPADVVLSAGFSNAVTVDGSPFFQSAPPFGSDLPPYPGDLPEDPSLEYDSFITLGDEFRPSDVTPDPSWDRDAFEYEGRVIGGWFDSNPGTEIHPESDGRVLMAQLTMDEGVSVEGTVTIFWQILGEGEVVATEMDWAGAEPLPVADLNGDGVVDSADLAMVLVAWGPCGGCPEDINDDGVVDSIDLVIVLSLWTIP